ncbi:hypothetical protein CF319_g6814 [Tilletia indica]|nr:hypothetical protein CF319_g6814 [Tilletia indica]
MSSTPIILSLVPVRDPEDAQSLAFTPADGLALFLGGTHRVSAYSKRPSFRAIDFTFDQQLLPPDHARISISGGNVSITALQDDDTVRVNGTSLVSKGWLPLRHQDRIELSYYEPYDDLINHVVTLDVHISSHPHTAPSLSTPSILHAFHALQVEALRLAEEVKMARKQLQDVRDAAEAHVCVSTPPPRSYGALLEDLRANAVGENFSGAETASLAATSCGSSPLLTSSSLRPACSLHPHSASTTSASPSASSSSSTSLPASPVSLNAHSSPSTSCPSSSSASEYSTSTSRPHQSHSTTSVLTSVLRLKSAPKSLPVPTQTSSPPGKLSAVTVSVASPSLPALDSPSPLRSSSPADFPTNESLLTAISTPAPPLISGGRRAELSAEGYMGGCNGCEAGGGSDIVADGFMLSDCSSSASPTAPGLHCRHSAVTAMERIRGEWMRARASLLTESSHASLRCSSSSPSSLDIALDRLRSAWIDARAYVIQVYDMRTDHTPAPSVFRPFESEPFPATGCPLPPQHSSAYSTPPTRLPRTAYPLASPLPLLPCAAPLQLRTPMTQLHALCRRLCHCCLSPHQQAHFNHLHSTQHCGL